MNHGWSASLDCFIDCCMDAQQLAARGTSTDVYLVDEHAQKQTNE